MRARTTAAALLCAAVAMTSTPTVAEEIDAGANLGLAGIIATVYEEENPDWNPVPAPPDTSWLDEWIPQGEGEGGEGEDADGVALLPPPDRELKKYRIKADCEFNGVLTPNNTLAVNVYGNADATGPAGAPPPLLTVIGCEISNVPSGGTNRLYRDFATNGPHSSVADSTVLTDVPEWDVRPVTVCVSGFAIFGPMPLRWVTLRTKCRTPDGEAVLR